MSYVSINTMTLAIAYIEDLVSHCNLNRIATLSHSLGVIKGSLINRNHFRALELIDKINPDDAFSHAVKLQLAAFFKKNESIAKATDIDSVTMAAFFSAEDSCRSQNLLENIYFSAPETDPHNLNFMRMKNRISKVLGPFSKFEDRLERLVRLSQGASSFHKRCFSTSDRKLFQQDEMSEDCAAIARYIYQDSPFVLGCLGYGTQDFNYSRIVTVPKSYKTNRTIAAEPAGHTAWQLAADSYIKDRLKMFSVDLTDQTPNQQLAFEGSCSGRYATIDLKQASDTISYEVVRLLFPEDWFNYFDAIRTPQGKLPDGSTVVFEKFSSMGNGTTFVIETLIFEAACFAASMGSIDRCVYGDDIVIRQEFVPDLISILSRFGFSINEAKTHTSGNYRESCGEHYFSGERVTPINLLRERMSLDVFYDFVNRFIDNMHIGPCSFVDFSRAMAVLQRTCRLYDENALIKGQPAIQFIPSFLPSTAGIKSPATHGNMRLWRVAIRDGMHFIKGISITQKSWRPPRLRAYLLWLQLYTRGQDRRQDSAAMGRKSPGHAIDVQLVPPERITSTMPHPDKVGTKLKLIPCLWQVPSNSNNSYFYTIDWSLFCNRNKPLKGNYRRKDKAV